MSDATHAALATLNKLKQDYEELKKARDTHWVKLAPYGIGGGTGRHAKKSAGMIEKIKQLQKENEKVEFYKDCFKQAEQERDYEHIRFLEEQSKRGDLEYEIEELKKENERLKNMIS